MKKINGYLYQMSIGAQNHEKTLVEGFLAFVKEQYGITMTAKESDHGESFQDLFGYEFDDVLTQTQ